MSSTLTGSTRRASALIACVQPLFKSTMGRRQPTTGISYRADNPVDLGLPQRKHHSFDGIGEPVNYPQDRHDNTYEFVDNLAWNTGRHQFKFGTDIRRFQLNSYLDFISRGEWFFNGLPTQTPSGTVCLVPEIPCPIVALAQLMAGFPDYAVSVQGTTNNGLRTTGLGTYIQDDIRVLPRLTLNAGLQVGVQQPTRRNPRPVQRS